jgi:hypothetical protein
MTVQKFLDTVDRFFIIVFALAGVIVISTTDDTAVILRAAVILFISGLWDISRSIRNSQPIVINDMTLRAGEGVEVEVEEKQ